MKTAIASRNIELDVLAASLSGGFMRIYSGKQPANPEAPATGTLLATLEFGRPAFAAASKGKIVGNALVSDLDCAATGDAGWCRCFKSDGLTAVLDGSVGDGVPVSEGGRGIGDANFRSINFQKHAQINLSGFDITFPQ